nr:putative integron gene cassette protein [uncultured bacterium]CAP48424.1 putative integron gene cassette protein [uncultured bacterium]CAP48425.1 putative integron gene cassette protein [uncultured bacterium]CAP48426.1 putative integron gene cassette protein [uncultured bacterium]
MVKNDPDYMILVFKRFFTGVVVNFVGLVVIEVARFIVGMGAFTNDVSSGIKFIDAISWLWPPISKLIYKNADLVIPTLGYTIISAVVMGLVFIIIGHWDTQYKRNNTNLNQNNKNA